MIGERRLENAKKVIEEFRVLDFPLSRFFSNYFKENPKAGSKDRRVLQDLVYAFYRYYHGIGAVSIEDKILVAYLLMGGMENSILELWKSRYPGSKFDTSNSLEKKKEAIAEVLPAIEWGALFPWKEFIAQGIDPQELEESYINQPKLFIRIYEPYAKILKQVLNEKGIGFEEINSYCLALDNRTNINSLKEGDLKSAFEIQDLSSQTTGEYFKAVPRTNWWDCCAGAGGKSLLLSQLYPGVNLWASDSRYSVIQNLEKRYTESGFPCPRTFVQDLLAEDNLAFREGFFEGIILDAPCSGSGTWSRTPERLGNFHPSSLGRMVEIQKKIGDKVIPYLNKGGALIYITCSIFKAENEEIVDYFMDRYKLKLESMQYLNGMNQGADTLFLARFIYEGFANPSLLDL